MKTLLEWARRLFMWPTHRLIRVCPGFWLQVPRGTTDRELARTLRRALAIYEMRKGKKNEAGH